MKAIRAVELDPNTRHNHVAVTTYKSRIIAVGHNAPHKSHPKQAMYSRKSIGSEHKIFLHAELAALVKSRSKIDTIWVVRINPSGQIIKSDPCPICQMAIAEADVDCYHS
ncbi:dCMP deaminase [Ralstonia phage RP13]|nr:dCMP deaminase [Ralstonia phage RP13]